MRNDKGQVLVETALLVPLLFVLIFAIAEFGRAIHTKSTLSNAARAGARAAAVTANLSPTSPTTLSLVAGEPAQSIRNTLSDSVPADAALQYRLEILDSSGAPIAGTVRAGNQVRVTLTYQNFPMITPLHHLLALISHTTAQDQGTISLTAQASMRYE